MLQKKKKTPVQREFIDKQRKAKLSKKDETLEPNESTLNDTVIANEEMNSDDQVQVHNEVQTTLEKSTQILYYNKHVIA